MLSCSHEQTILPGNIPFLLFSFGIAVQISHILQGFGLPFCLIRWTIMTMPVFTVGSKMVNGVVEVRFSSKIRVELVSNLMALCWILLIDADVPYVIYYNP